MPMAAIAVKTELTLCTPSICSIDLGVIACVGFPLFDGFGIVPPSRWHRT